MLCNPQIAEHLEIAVTGQVFGGRKQHGRMTVPPEGLNGSDLDLGRDWLNQLHIAPDGKWKPAATLAHAVP